jgi:hypothetical protein
MLAPPLLRDFAHFTRHGASRPLVVRIAAVVAVEGNADGQDQHKASIHVGGPHPLRVDEPIGTVLGRLGWPRLGEFEE